MGIWKIEREKYYRKVETVYSTINFQVRMCIFKLDTKKINRFHIWFLRDYVCFSIIGFDIGKQMSSILFVSKFNINKYIHLVINLSRKKRMRRPCRRIYSPRPIFWIVLYSIVMIIVLDIVLWGLLKYTYHWMYHGHVSS